MIYKGWTITRGQKQFSHGITVSGWIMTNGVRTTMAESKELAMRYIDNLEDSKHE